MELYLMQHGEAFPESADPKRHLTPQGERQIQESARALQKLGVQFDRIVASSKMRSQQTARIVAQVLSYPLEEISETASLDPMATGAEMLVYLRGLGKDGRILLVGHLPSLGRLASDLLSWSAPVSIHFEMGGVCRIDPDPNLSGPGELRWYLTPEQLSHIAGNP